MNPAIKTKFYFQVTDVWKRFCEEHVLLFDLTCDEYSLLLGSEIEQLELKIAEKEATVKRITLLEELRTELITSINNESLNSNQIESMTDLVNFFSTIDEEVKNRHLFRFNALLIDLIEKIQGQNKKNQTFINKALFSLKSIREEVLGKNYGTYSQKGVKVHNTNGVRA